MKKILQVIDTWGVRVVTILMIVVFLKTCSTNGRIERLNKDANKLNVKVDSLTNELRNEIKIEGLKSEKRMIQSTDRRMMDVNRQSEIDKEISKLNK